MFGRRYRTGNNNCQLYSDVRTTLIFFVQKYRSKKYRIKDNFASSPFFFRGFSCFRRPHLERSSILFRRERQKFYLIASVTPVRLR